MSLRERVEGGGSCTGGFIGVMRCNGIALQPSSSLLGGQPAPPQTATTAHREGPGGGKGGDRGRGPGADGHEEGGGAAVGDGPARGPSASGTGGGGI